MYSMAKPRNPYNSNWLAEFTEQNRQNTGAQNVLASNLYGQQPSYQSQPMAEPYMQNQMMSDVSLMSRYLKENAPLSSPASSTAGNYSNNPMSGAVNQVTQQPMDYAPANAMNINAVSPPQDDYTDFTDEGGETFKIKKQPKPAYDWSQDFG
jgi:hypothetical protein